MKSQTAENKCLELTKKPVQQRDYFRKPYLGPVSTELKCEICSLYMFIC